MMGRPAYILRFFICLSIFVGTLVPAAREVCADEREAAEYEVKAAFLYNFAKFTEWPSASFASDQAPLAICILGDNPFGKAFDPIRSKTVRNRSVAIREIVNPDAAKGCQVLFISASERERFDDILRSLGTRSVLTVSDVKRFTQSGGMITFVTVDGKIRFEINNRAASHAGLKISSQMLKLAETVIE